MPSFTLEHIANHIGAELKGDPSCVVTQLAPIEEATAGQLSFLDNAKYRQYLFTTQASAVILSSNFSKECSVSALVMPNPYLGFAKAAELFYKKISSPQGIHPSAVIEQGAVVHPTASIGPFCVIAKNAVIEEGVILGSHCMVGEESLIGANSHLWGHVTLYHGVKIGQRVVIHSGVVVGSDGFGNANEKGIWYKVPQLGGVLIGDDVEIGANTSIDRGTLNNTIIENGVKLDNQIQIGHNVKIGAHTAVAGCVGIAGSTTIGKYCRIGGGAGLAGHLNIVDGVAITAGTGVARSITVPGVYSAGIPAEEASKWRRNLMRIYQLDDMARRLKKVEKNNL